MQTMRGTGRAAFAGILLLLVGPLNIIYGIAAIDGGNFFDNTQHVFSNLDTWGWIWVILGIIQIIAGVSVLKGGAFGIVIGVFAAGLGALEALLSVGGTHPWWSLGIFAMCLWIIHGLVVYGRQEPEGT